MGTTIRRSTVADAQALAAIYDPIVAGTHISFEERPPGPEEMRRRIASAGDRYPWLVCESEHVLGYAYASQHRARAAYRWAIDVSVYVAPHGRRRGVARALYAELLRLLAAQGYYAAFAGVALPNEASRALHQSLGFNVVGIYHAVGFKSNAWHDVMWFERRLRPAADVPAEPLSLSELQRLQRQHAAPNEREP